MPRKKSEKKRPNVISAFLSAQAKAQLNQVCEHRGMSIKMFLGRLIEWFLELNLTEQSIVLKHVEDQDVTGLAEMIAHHKPKPMKRA